MKPTNPESARQFWRTLDEKNGANLSDLVGDEFASRLPDSFSEVERRSFLKLMGASLALAGMAGCTRQPPEQIVPYVRQPELMIPGTPLFFATTMTLGGRGTGLLVESHEGRPTKVEGNPLHPASLGATDAFAQASLLDLYDPNRMQTLTHAGDVRGWPAFVAAMRTVANAQHASKGAGLRVLTESVCSPTFAAQMQELMAAFPAARWHQWEPGSEFNNAAGLHMITRRPASAHFNVAAAAVIVCLDADFLNCGAGNLRYARHFAERRRPEGAGCRLYAAESMPTPTGAKSDHRLRLKPSEIESLARTLAADLGVPGVDRGAALPSNVQPWLVLARNELQRHRGSSIVVAGEGQPPLVHALAHAMNLALGNANETVFYTDAVEPRPIDHVRSITALAQDMAAGRVEALLIFGGNPVYSAPADLRFAESMQKVPLRVHLSLTANETSALSHWQIPEAHFLESWSDARAFDGTASIVQPLIAPLYGGRSTHEVAATLSDRPERTAYQIVREFWRKGGVRGAEGAFAGDAEHAFEQFWRRAVHDGVVQNTALPTWVPMPDAPIAAFAAPQARPAEGFEIAFRTDPTIYDGRFSGNPWLQELPKPLTHLTWDNAIIVSPATLERLGARAFPAMTGGERGQVRCSLADLTFQGRLIRGALFPLAGHPDDVATLHLGYGRQRAGHIGTGHGFNAYAVRTSDALAFGTGAQIAVREDLFPLACVQYHHLLEGRASDILRVVPRDELDTLRPDQQEPPSLWPVLTDQLEEIAPYSWGMSIDINACTGCNACVVSCQAENNIPVIGKAEVLRGREMHWLRVDTYHQGEVENPSTYFQPVPCMHCETAPCEPVCPVAATVHSIEGLNDMVYNRCVGTRYCSNNCPYKVRRFNFLQYADWDTPILKLVRNPDVTVRSRGVMEKCTYCVQRISAARIEASREGRRIRDGEVETACQSVCPTRAIVFGDIKDPDTRVSRLKAEPRNYAMLHDLNTRPRTTYLSAIADRNPEFDEAPSPPRSVNHDG